MTADPTAAPHWLDLPALFGSELLEQIAALTAEATDLRVQVQDLLHRGKAVDEAWSAALTGHPDEAVLRTEEVFTRLYELSGLDGLTMLCYGMAGGDTWDSFGGAHPETVADALADGRP